MTISQLNDIVGTLLGYIGTDKRSHPYDVFFVGDAIRGVKIGEYVKQYGKSTLGQFCLPIVFDVKYDELRARKYIDLETQILGLDNNSGIIQVTLPQEEDNDFIVRQSGMTAVYANLIAGRASKQKCFLEGTKIYFAHLEPEQTKIMVKAIPSLFHWVMKGEGEWIYYDSELPQPYDFNAFLIEGARQWFEEQKTSPDDKTNDGIAPRMIYKQ